MNDRFLYQARPKIRDEFADSLYAELTRPRTSLPRPLAKIRSRSTALRFMGLLALGLAIIAACAYHVLRPTYRNVGDIWVYEISVRHVPPLLSDHPATAEAPTRIPLSDALAMLDFPLQLPAWTPDTFEIYSNNQVIAPSGPPYRTIFFYWANPEGDSILLVARRFEGDYAGQVSGPRGSWRQVTIHGHPAVLVCGAFPPPSASEVTLPSVQPSIQRWDDTLGLTLVWVEDNVFYQLETTGDYIPSRDLIRMADSFE